VLLLVEEGRRCCYLSKRPAGVAACRGEAPSRGVGHGPWQGVRKGRTANKGRRGVPARGGGQRRARADGRFLHDAAVSLHDAARRKENEGDFSYSK
jgi:hypothetical protein